MKAAIVDNDLLLAGKLAAGLRALGHEVRIVGSFDQVGSADIAFVNLGNRKLGALEGLADFRALFSGKIVGYAGHREKEIHARGRELGCDLTATNREIVSRLGPLISRTFRV
ncbi:MAG: hypothetical protein HUU60_09965 [Armatimonadetes bacterium]|nr:hypothetical protein [Armatimonadota bacterium]